DRQDERALPIERTENFGDRAAAFHFGRDRLRSRQRDALFRGDAAFDIGDDALRLVQTALAREPARAFGNVAADDPDGDRTERADQDDDAPVLEPQWVRVFEDEGEKCHDGHRAKGDELIDRIRAAALAAGDELGDVGVDGYEF